MSLSRLKVGHRIAAGFLVVIVTMITITALGISRVEQINERLTTINDVNSVKQRYAINFRGSVHDRAISLRDVVLADTPEAAQPSIAEIEELTAKYDESAEKMDALFADPAEVSAAEQEALAEIQRIEAEGLPLIERVVELRMSGDLEAAHEALMTEAKPMFIDWLAAINVFIDLEEAMNQEEAAAARGIGNAFFATMLLLCGLATAISGTVAWLVVRSIVRPVRELADRLAELADGDGDLTVRMDESRGDELGVLSANYNRFVTKVADTIREISRTTATLDSASEQLNGTAQDIATSAEEASAQAGVVAAAASQVSSNVQTVAAGSEEMGASIREIASNASEAARVAAEAVTVTETTNATVSKLGESSREIGDVVKVITSIAEQTNLLALNATIEADTSGAVAAFGQISEIIARISDFQTTIASAVEEQTATTNEMSRSVAEAAGGSTQIADNITGVAQAASSTTEGVARAQQAAAELARTSSELQTLVGRFTV